VNIAFILLILGFVGVQTGRSNKYGQYSFVALVLTTAGLVIFGMFGLVMSFAEP